MIVDAFDADRFERPISDMQGHADPLDALNGKRVEHCRREMKAGGQHRDRAALARINRLIAIARLDRTGRLMYGGKGTWPIDRWCRDRRPVVGPEP